MIAEMRKCSSIKGEGWGAQGSSFSVPCNLAKESNAISSDQRPGLLIRYTVFHLEAMSDMPCHGKHLPGFSWL